MYTKSKVSNFFIKPYTTKAGHDVLVVEYWLDDKRTVVKEYLRNTPADRRRYASILELGKPVRFVNGLAFHGVSHEIEWRKNERGFHEVKR